MNSHTFIIVENNVYMEKNSNEIQQLYCFKSERRITSASIPKQVTKLTDCIAIWSYMPISDQALERLKVCIWHKLKQNCSSKNKTD